MPAFHRNHEAICRRLRHFWALKPRRWSSAAAMTARSHICAARLNCSAPTPGSSHLESIAAWRQHEAPLNLRVRNISNLTVSGVEWQEANLDQNHGHIFINAAILPRRVSQNRLLLLICRWPTTAACSCTPFMLTVRIHLKQCWLRRHVAGGKSGTGCATSVITRARRPSWTSLAEITAMPPQSVRYLHHASAELIKARKRLKPMAAEPIHDIAHRLCRTSDTQIDESRKPLSWMG